MANYKQFKQWLDRCGIVFIDPGMTEPESSYTPGYFTLTDDMRHVRDLHRSKDKKQCLIWHDGEHVRIIEGVAKLKPDEDNLTWSLVDKYGTPYRISCWWTPEHKKMRQSFIETRQPLSGKAVSRMAYTYQGKEPMAAINTPVSDWSEADAP